MIWQFYLLELLIYIPRALFSFIGNYFNQLHFSDLQNGLLGSAASIIILISNPFWMRFADRKIKNKVLSFVAMASAILIWEVYLFKNFWIVLIMTFTVGFVWTSILPLAESISITHLNQHGFSFGKARMMGSIGFAISMIVFGYLKNDVIFFLIGSVTFLLIGLTALFLIPKIHGYNVGKQKIKFSFKNLPGEFYRMLILETLVISSGNFGLYFFPILMKSRGEPVSFAGIAIAIHALSEVPFLFFADHIVTKLGVKKILVIASLAYGIRWILTWSVSNPILVISFQALEFFNFIAIYYAIWHYVSSNIKPQHRSDAQAIFLVITTGISAIFGYIVGGWVSNAFGVKNGYLFFGILSICVAIIYGLYEYSKSIPSLSKQNNF
ncbi:MAG TPA: MFS transporter [Thermodesulfobium narugense]|nr:MFS transporter [Thermodesulfobium narugense]